MPATDSDLRRLACLDAMGVVLYCSRRDLPGAAPSRRVALPAAVPASGAAAETPPPSRRPPIAVRGLVDGAGEAAREAPSGPAPPSPRPAASGAERFVLAAIVTGGAVWVEDLGDLPLAREQVRLVRAMAVACGWQPQQPQVQRFAWPLHDNPQLDSGRDAAAAALHAFLGRLLEESAGGRVVLLGSAAAERVDGARLPAAVTVLPSTRELLAEPARKREAWEILRPLGTA